MGGAHASALAGCEGRRRGSAHRVATRPSVWPELRPLVHPPQASLVCPLTKKRFKTRAAYENHVRSKKYAALLAKATGEEEGDAPASAGAAGGTAAVGASAEPEALPAAPVVAAVVAAAPVSGCSAAGCSSSVGGRAEEARDASNPNFTPSGEARPPPLAPSPPLAPAAPPLALSDDMLAELRSPRPIPSLGPLPPPGPLPSTRPLGKA